MGTTTTPMTAPGMQAVSAEANTLLISLPVLQQDSTDELLRKLRNAFTNVNTIVAIPEGVTPLGDSDQQRTVVYEPASSSAWTLTAADFSSTLDLCSRHGANAALILGPAAESLDQHAIEELASPVLNGAFDLAVPRYAIPSRSGLVTSAILYPVSRALFGASPRFPQAIDLCLSIRMAQRLSSAAQPFLSANQPDAIVWPVSEAAVANFTITQVDVGARAVPQPGSSDLNAPLAQITGSLFADVDAKASFWQRNRIATPIAPTAAENPPSDARNDDVRAMLEAFRLAYGNLAEIWSLVLPPQTLFGLKRLSSAPADAFLMPDALWVRIIYDFVLAYRLRTINRGHLLGALTPLYLAWVASHIKQISEGANSEALIRDLAVTFETDKPYLVSRWRWPDRFNP